MIHLKPLVIALTACALCACSAAPSAPDRSDRAAADIGNLKDGGAQVQIIQTPPGYKQGDKLIAYEGPGWESDKTAFRLYLDGRNALDIFGKRTADMTLRTVGRGEDYHSMAPWGMDILKVSNSLGAGGFGVFDGGTVRQIGEAQSYHAEITRDDNDMAALRVTHVASQSCGGDIAADYAIKGGERMSRITISGDCALPYAAGLIIHPGTEAMASTGSGAWQYKARYGVQSLSDDNLGLALFYRAGDVETVGADEDDDYIVFKSSARPDYYTAAAWAQEPGGITTAEEFTAWLEKTRAALNASEK